MSLLPLACSSLRAGGRAGTRAGSGPGAVAVTTGMGVAVAAGPGAVATTSSRGLSCTGELYVTVAAPVVAVAAGAAEAVNRNAAAGPGAQGSGK